MTTSPEDSVVDVGSPDSGPPSLFQRLALGAHHRRWWTLLLWLVTLVAVSLGAQTVGDSYHNDYGLPGTESQRALDALRERAPTRAGSTVQIVLKAPEGLRQQATRTRVESMLTEVGEAPHVVDVTSPYDDRDAVSPDGTIGYATVTLDRQSEQMPAADTRALVTTAQQAATDGLRVELAGDAVREAQAEEGGAAEGLGMLAALVILVFLFGSVVAAALPLVIAVFAVGTTLGLTVLASHLATVADFTAPLLMLVGLGVGIDYALLVFARFRGELLAGHSRREATARALDTAGRTVFFAGCTVIIALLGLVLLGLGALQGVAVAVALTVLLTMLSSLTLLPALLGVLGERLERQVRRRSTRDRGAEGARWDRWSARVQRRPWLALLVPGAVLLALCAPALEMRLGFADAGTEPPHSTARRAYDLLAEGFGPGFNGPLTVVVDGSAQAADRARDTLAETEGVAAVSGGPAADGLSTLVVFPSSAPQDEATEALVNRLRDEVLPQVAARTSATFLVGGSTAAALDFSQAVADRLPLFVTVVVGLSMALLLLVFRSVLIPLKAAVLNLLSVGVAMGVVTWVFQYGTLGAQPGPIEAYVPVMVFAIVFGLSMDYEVFLLARMHEEWRRGGDAASAVRRGMATTGRVVTAAAAIMIVVFGAFVFSGDRMLGEFGLGLAVAVLVDALFIRCLLLPALMQLFGDRAWWLPHGLARRLPRLALERH